MSIVTKEILKTYFDDGSRPTGNNFADLIDSLGHVDAGFATGGNSFGANASLGTNDPYSLQLKTNNQTRISIDSAGNFISLLAPSSITANSLIPLTVTGSQSGGTVRLTLQNSAISGVGNHSGISLNVLNSSANQITAGTIAANLTTTTAGNETSQLYFNTYTNGVNTTKLSINGDNIYVTSSATVPLTVTGSNANNSVVNVFRNAAPSNTSNHSGIRLQVKNSAGADTSAVDILGRLTTITSGSEIGELAIRVNNAGTLSNIALFNSSATVANYFVFRSRFASSLNVLEILAQGSDTNIPIRIFPKGASNVTIVGQSGNTVGDSIFSLSNTTAAGGDSTFVHNNSASPNTSNRSVIRLVQSNSVPSSSCNTYIYGQSTGITTGSEQTRFGVDTMISGVRTTVFYIDGNTSVLSPGGGSAASVGVRIERSSSINHTTSSAASLLTIGNTSFNPSSGSGSLNSINITTTYNQISTATGTIRGIYYNPTITSVLGTHYAFESTFGDVKLGGTSQKTYLNELYVLDQDNSTYKAALQSNAVSGHLEIGYGFTVVRFISGSVGWQFNSTQFSVPSNGILLANASSATDVFNFTATNIANVGFNFRFQSGRNETTGTYAHSQFSWNHTPASASTANYTSLQFKEVVNQYTGSTGVITSIDINPNLLSLTGTYYGLRSRINANLTGGGTAWNIYASGTASNYFGGDIVNKDTNAIYLGDPDTDGTYRIKRDGNNLITERRESGTYVVKQTITA